MEEDVQGGDPFDDHVYKKDDKAPSEIAALLHRSKSSVTRHLFVKTASATQGRKLKLTEAQVGSIVREAKQYIKQAAGRYRITYDMIKRHSRTKVSTWTLIKLFNARASP